jgi:Nucleotidyltransferase domain
VADLKRNVNVPRHYLDDLMSALGPALGESLSAVYITGSAAVGAYRPGSSDLDVLVAVEGASQAELERVVASCAHEVLPCPAIKLELVVYEADELRAPHVPPRWSLNFDTGESTHEVDWDPATQPSHWFVLDLAFAHRHAQPLWGSAVIGTPPADAVERAFGEMIKWFETNEPAEVPVARQRAEHWKRTGTFMPKPGLPST